MNKQNKLARNAIRARKAQKKRANEQDKPKSGKRWITRLFALVGCLLLVSALALPCFADDVDVPDIDWLVVYGDFRNDIPERMHRLLVTAESRIGEFIFDYDYMNAGVISQADFTFPFRSLGPDFNLTGSTKGERRVDRVTIEYDGQYPESSLNYPYLPRAYFVYSIYTDFGDDYASLIIDCYDYDTDGLIFHALFEGSSNGDGYGDYVDISLSFLSSPLFLDGAELNPTLFYIGVLSNGYNTGFDVIERALFYDFSYRSPAEWISGYYASRSYYYQLGYDLGYRLGASQTDLYQQGYNQAISEIDSGDFGRNLLGKFFNAPLSALSGFVIAEFDLGDDTAPVRITIGGIVSVIVGVSLTIWFLKMVAGG